MIICIYMAFGLPSTGGPRFNLESESLGHLGLTSRETVLARMLTRCGPGLPNSSSGHIPRFDSLAPPGIEPPMPTSTAIAIARPHSSSTSSPRSGRSKGADHDPAARRAARREKVAGSSGKGRVAKRGGSGGGCPGRVWSVRLHEPQQAQRRLIES
jgi:hypothetical protein